MPAMPFGKYRDENLEEIPTSYLLWLRDNVELKAWLDRAVRRELRSRDADGPRDGYEHEETRRTDPPPLPDMRGLVSRWHRHLSNQFHTDAGGDGRAMQAINAGRDALLEMLAGEGLLR